MRPCRPEEPLSTQRQNRLGGLPAALPERTLLTLDAGIGLTTQYYADQFRDTADINVLSAYGDAQRARAKAFLG